MWIINVCLVCCILCLQFDHVTGCAEGWFLDVPTEACYKLVTEQKLQWSDAVEYCGSRYSFLTDMVDYRHQMFIKDTVLNNVHIDYGVWLGATDRHGGWKWVTNKWMNIDLFLWRKGNPDNGRVLEGWVTGEDCLQMSTESGVRGQLNDYYCDKSLYFVCKSPRMFMSYYTSTTPTTPTTTTPTTTTPTTITTTTTTPTTTTTTTTIDTTYMMSYVMTSVDQSNETVLVDNITSLDSVTRKPQDPSFDRTITVVIILSVGAGLLAFASLIIVAVRCRSRKRKRENVAPATATALRLLTIHAGIPASNRTDSSNTEYAEIGVSSNHLTTDVKHTYITPTDENMPQRTSAGTGTTHGNSGKGEYAEINESSLLPFKTISQKKPMLPSTEVQGPYAHPVQRLLNEHIYTDLANRLGKGKFGPLANTPLSSVVQRNDDDCRNQGESHDFGYLDMDTGHYEVPFKKRKEISDEKGVNKTTLCAKDHILATSHDKKTTDQIVDLSLHNTYVTKDQNDIGRVGQERENTSTNVDNAEENLRKKNETVKQASGVGHNSGYLDMDSGHYLSPLEKR